MPWWIPLLSIRCVDFDVEQAHEKKKKRKIALKYFCVRISNIFKCIRIFLMIEWIQWISICAIAKIIDFVLLYLKIDAKRFSQTKYSMLSLTIHVDNRQCSCSYMSVTSLSMSMEVYVTKQNKWPDSCLQVL